jgi:hypothetical protein
MLNPELIKKINESVYSKPRTIQEISLLLNVNWRTADNYVEKIAKELGTLSVRTFREGTRGALKIVFWNNIERMHVSEAQERLFRLIESGRKKEDFSPSEIFQYVDPKARRLKILNMAEYGLDENFNDFANLLKSAKSQILFFSGNMTFSNREAHDIKIQNILEDLAKQKITSKVLTRVELAGLKNVQNALAINQRIGWNALEIRHCFQPLRTTIIDSDVAVFKEILDPKDFAEGELKEKTYLLYYIYDPDWISWLQKVFWHLFRPAVDAKTRITMLEPFKSPQFCNKGAVITQT